MTTNKYLKEAIIGVLFFSVVYTLVSLTNTIYGALGVLFGSSFILYWFVYKIRKLSFYLKSFVYIGGMVALFLLAGKAGIAAIIALHIIVPAWIIFRRRERIKEGYKEFERQADLAFPRKEEVKVQAKKPVKKKLSTPNKRKTQSNKKRSTTGDKAKRASKSGAVKKRRKNSTKKATNK